VLAGAVRLARQAQLPLRLEVPAYARVLGHALFREGEWLQNVDVHNLNVSAAVRGAECKTLCLPEVRGVNAPSEVSVGEDVRFRAWV